MIILIVISCNIYFCLHQHICIVDSPSSSILAITWQGPVADMCESLAKPSKHSPAYHSFRSELSCCKAWNVCTLESETMGFLELPCDFQANTRSPQKYPAARFRTNGNNMAKHIHLGPRQKEIIYSPISRFSLHESTRFCWPTMHNIWCWNGNDCRPRSPPQLSL